MQQNLRLTDLCCRAGFCDVRSGSVDHRRDDANDEQRNFARQTFPIGVLADGCCLPCRYLGLVLSPDCRAHLGLAGQIFGNNHRLDFL